MRRALPLLAVTLLLLVSCGGEPPAPLPPSPAGPSTTPTPDPVTTSSPPPEPSASPEPAPGEMPTGYDPDVGAPEVPPEAMIPESASITGEWFAFTGDGLMIVVAWAEPGGDLTELPRGFAVWRRAASAPHWRPAFVRRHRAEEGLTEVQVTTADVTGDGSDDVLAFEGIGGSGACGSWLVLDLLSMERIYRKDLCDGRIEPAQPPGLVLTESVYRAGDAHCCPSAMRRTSLVWSGSGWRVTERTESGT